MQPKYLAGDCIMVLQHKVDFLVVYHKYVSDNHFHLQCLIDKKLYFFVIQIFDKSVDIYDAKNDFLHTFSKEHPAFAVFQNPVNKPFINMDASIHLISNQRKSFTSHRPGIHSLTTPDHEQSIIYDVSDLKEAA